MEIILLSIVVLLVTTMLGFVLLRAFQLVNTLNKRQIFLLEKMYDLMGGLISNTVGEMEAGMSALEIQMNQKLNNNPEEPYDPFKEVAEGKEDLS